MIIRCRLNLSGAGRGLRPFSFFLIGLVVASILAVPAPSSAATVVAAPARTAPAVPTPALSVPFFPNVKVTDGSSPYAWQVEPTMVVNRSGTIFVGWKETSGSEAAGIRVGSSYSTDQGLTWAPNILMNQSHPDQNCHNSDPWMALAPDDRVHYAYLEYDCQSYFDITNTTTGQDWGQVHSVIGNGGLVDKDSMWVAPNRRIYAAWDEGNVLAVTWSDDGGSTWKKPFIDPSDGHSPTVLGTVVETASNGTLCLVWWDFGRSNIYFDWSADGGTTWHADKRVNDRDGSASGGGWQLSIPAMNVDQDSGAIYVAWPDARNGNLDIFLSSSTDGGQTWAANTRINGDTGSSTQYMVDLAIDSRGTVHAAWEDKRSNNWNIFYSNSTDGGHTWGANVRVSSEDTPGSYNRPGDYFAIETGPNDYIYLVWTDGRSQDFDIYYARNPGFPAATITVTTSPASLPVAIDGATTTAPVVRNWTIGSLHSIGVASPIPIGATARYLWTDWSDGGAISHSIVADSDRTITASFKKQYQGKVAPDPTGLTVLVDNIAYSAATFFWWDDGSAHWIEAPTPQSASSDVRWVWVAWSDGGSAAHAITANGALTFTATFLQEQAMRVSTAPEGLAFTLDGTVYSAATTFWFQSGSYHTVSVDALQSGGSGIRYRFTSWSDAGAATHVVAFTGAMSVQAQFSPEYYLTVTSPVLGAGGSGWYPAGTGVVATVTNAVYAQAPGERLSFQGWAGDATGSGLTSDPIVMDAPKTAIAEYGAQFYLEVSSAYGTAVGTGWYDAGSTATPSVSPTEASLGAGVRVQFVRWSGDASGTGATSVPIVMDRAKVASIVWRTQYYLAIQTPYGAAKSQGWYNATETAYARLDTDVVSLAAGTRAVFLSWIGDATGTDATGSSPILMDRPRTVGASWRIEYELLVDTDYGHSIGAGWYQVGSFAVAAVNASVIGTAPGQRVVFAGWSGDAAGDSASGSSPIAMSAPKTAVAHWSTDYLLRVDSDVGTIGGSGWYSSGDSVTLEAPAQLTSGGQTYQFAGWTGGVTSADRTVTVTVNGPTTVRATWASTGALGGVSMTTYGLIILVIAVALAVGFLAWRRRGRRD